MKRGLKIGLLTFAEFLVLFGLWMAFVSNPKLSELWVGLVVAAIGAVADAIVKKEGLARFNPKLSWVLLIFWEPWYTLTGTWAVLKALVRTALGKKSEAQFTVKGYDYGGQDARSSAKRTLATTYMTIPPNFIIVGIDRRKQQVLVHQVEPTSTPLIAKKLGVHE